MSLIVFACSPYPEQNRKPDKKDTTKQKNGSEEQAKSKMIFDSKIFM
jgi:hypothetical protein